MTGFSLSSAVRNDRLIYDKAPTSTRHANRWSGLKKAAIFSDINRLIFDEAPTSIQRANRWSGLEKAAMRADKNRLICDKAPTEKAP